MLRILGTGSTLSEQVNGDDLFQGTLPLTCSMLAAAEYGSTGEPNHAISIPWHL